MSVSPPDAQIRTRSGDKPMSQAIPAVAAEETFDRTWAFEARYTEAPGFRMHYVDEGKGETVLALHGEPTWGYLFRNLIKALSPRHRVIALDHMGFGKSETPQGKAIHALGKISARADREFPVAVLVRAIKDDDAIVQLIALWSLLRIGPKAEPTIPALTELLKEEDKFVRWAASVALKNIQGIE